MISVYLSVCLSVCCFFFGVRRHVDICVFVVVEEVYISNAWLSVQASIFSHYFNECFTLWISKGMTREVANLIRENSELLQTKYECIVAL